MEPQGVESKIKADGTPVTSADGDAEDAVRSSQFAERLVPLFQMTVFLAKKSVQYQAEMDADGLWTELMERMVLLPV